MRKHCFGIKPAREALDICLRTEQIDIFRDGNSGRRCVVIRSPESQRLAPNQDHLDTGELEDTFEQLRGDANCRLQRQEVFFCSSGNDTFVC